VWGSKEALHDRQYGIKEDHTQGASEVNMSVLDDLYDCSTWVIIVQKEEKRDNMTSVESHESIQYITLPRFKCTMVVISLIFGILFDILYISNI